MLFGFFPCSHSFLVIITNFHCFVTIFCTTFPFSNKAFLTASFYHHVSTYIPSHFPFFFEDFSNTSCFVFFLIELIACFCIPTLLSLHLVFWTQALFIFFLSQTSTISLIYTLNVTIFAISRRSYF